MKKSKFNKICAIVLLIGMSTLLTACGGGNKGSGNSTLKNTLNVAYNAQPATFDPHVTGATATREIDRNVFEGLFEEDADGNPKPQLCESYDKTDDNKEWTFHLRKGVKFHNGEEMKSDDVIASLNRWLDKNAIARKSIPSWKFEKVDDYTVKLILDEPCLLLPYVLSNYAQFSAILPASVIEKAGDNNIPIDQLIGTGPYKFEDWIVDSHVVLKKFNDYKAISKESSGAWGDRTAYTDTVNIYFVTDTTTRLNGLETGEYDIATNLAYTDTSKIEGIENVKLLKEDWNSITITMNKSESSVLSNSKWRQIISYAVDFNDILSGCYSTMTKYVPYSADACYFNKKSQWYADVSSIQHQDISKAKQLLKEVNYDGTPLKMMTTQAYPELYNASLILKQQLEDIGVKIDLQVYDWGTMLTKISDKTAFDLYPMNYPASSAPVCVNYITKTNASGFTDDQTLNEYILNMNSFFNIKDAKEFWYKTAMPYCADQAFILHLGTYDVLTGVSNKVEGFEQYYGMKLWGVKVYE